MPKKRKKAKKVARRKVARKVVRRKRKAKA